MTRAAGPPGWHGKLPSLGDFASRRLDAAFVEAWDGWLAGGLLALREAAPETWLEAYLGSPSWRFLLMPGVMPGVSSSAPGQGAWAGVLMPSVDRVGRYFPLTLVQPLGPGPASTQEMAALWQWLGRLDELARDALHEDWTADRLEEELALMARPDIAHVADFGDTCDTGNRRDTGDLLVQSSAADTRRADADGVLLEWAPGVAGNDAAVHIGRQAQALWAQAAQGRAWWYARPDDAAPRLLLSRGLPAAASFGLLFGPAATTIARDEP